MDVPCFASSEASVADSLGIKPTEALEFWVIKDKGTYKSKYSDRLDASILSRNYLRRGISIYF